MLIGPDETPMRIGPEEWDANRYMACEDLKRRLNDLRVEKYDCELPSAPRGTQYLVLDGSHLPTPYDSRVIVPAGKYLAKLTRGPRLDPGEETLVTVAIGDCPFPDAKNAALLKLNGFKVPYHVAIGVSIEDGLVSVSDAIAGNGIGAVLCEDLTRNGTVEVRGVKPWDFVTLENGGQLFQEYSTLVGRLARQFFDQVPASTHAESLGRMISMCVSGKEYSRTGELALGHLGDIQLRYGR